MNSSHVPGGKPRVIMLDRVAYTEMGPPTRQRIEEVFNLTRLWEVEDREAYLAAHGAEFRGILSRGVLPETVLDRLPNLEIVSQTGVGTDKAPIAYFRAHGISYTNTRGSLSDSVADIAITLALCVTRGIVPGDQRVRSGLWASERPPMGRSFSGRNYGILGLGSIGGEIARRLEGFGGTIRYHNRTPAEGAAYEYCATPMELATRSDFLFVALPGGAGTERMVDEQVLRALGPDGIVVNVGRGGTIDEEALVRVLEDGGLGGAGLDVHAHEPHAHPKLIGMQNVVLLPHLGSSTVETRAAMHALCIDNLLAHFEGRPLLTPIWDASKPGG
jgi:lactate dehydrogenase-like 2-hydroxyacid dehydrogenase